MRRAIANSGFDIMAALGFCAAIYGVWQVKRPLAWMIGGTIVMAYFALVGYVKPRGR